MEFKDYQDKAKKTALYPNVGNNIYYPTMGLSAEVGEVSNKVKKVMRDHADVTPDEYKEILKKELGDVLWYISTLCTELGLSLDEVAQQNIFKLYSRLDRGTIQGDGDNR